MLELDTTALLLDNELELFASELLEATTLDELDFASLELDTTALLELDCTAGAFLTQRTAKRLCKL